MTIYKYHIMLHRIYKKHSNSSFVSKELDELNINSMMQNYLRQKKFVRYIKRKQAEELRPEMKEWINAPWSFQKLTQEGLKVARFLDKNEHLIAKKLLRL